MRDNIHASAGRPREVRDAKCRIKCTSQAVRLEKRKFPEGRVTNLKNKQTRLIGGNYPASFRFTAAKQTCNGFELTKARYK